MLLCCSINVFAQKDSLMVRTMDAMQALLHRPESVTEERAVYLILHPGKTDSIQTSKRVVLDRFCITPFTGDWKQVTAYQFYTYDQKVGTWQKLWSRDRIEKDTESFQRLFEIVICFTLILFIGIPIVHYFDDLFSLKRKKQFDASYPSFRLPEELSQLFFFRREIIVPLLAVVSFVTAVRGNILFWISFSFWFIVVMTVSFILRNYLANKTLAMIARRNTQLENV